MRRPVRCAELASYHTFGPFTNRPAEELATRVAALAPLEDAKVFITAGGGSDAIDTAGKLARAYWNVSGRPEKRVIVSRNLAYHGVNAYGTSLGEIPANEALFGRLVKRRRAGAVGRRRRAQGDRRATWRRARGRVRCAAGRRCGSVLPPPPGYLEPVAEICRANDVLLIADECDHPLRPPRRLCSAASASRIRPDLITAGEGDHLRVPPARRRRRSGASAEPFWKRAERKSAADGYTFSGHATACAVAHANLDVLESEGLIEPVRELEPVLMRPCVRSRSTARPLKCARSGSSGRSSSRRATPTASPPRRASAAWITRAPRGVALQFSPPFVITDEQLGTVAAVIRECLDAVG